MKKLLTASLPLVLLGLGLFAARLADKAWVGFLQYQSPFAFEGRGLRPLPARVERVVLVLVDGLGLGPSAKLPFLNELRARGGDADLRVGLPSLSYPGRAVMLSGAWQEIHGQTTNKNPRPLRVEHVFSLARKQGLPTALASGANALTLFSPDVEHKVEYPNDWSKESQPLDTYEAELKRMVPLHLALVERVKRGFVMIEYHNLDEAGHNWGAASAEYARAAADDDAELRRLAERLDLGRTVLVVTSDHGHVPEGGHGGPEEPVMHVPFVIVGPHVRPGSKAVGSQTDVASTLAVLLGTALPASNQGRPLLELLDLDGAARLEALQALVAQRQSFVAGYAGWVLGRAPGFIGGAPPADEAGVEARLQAFDRTVAQARAERSARERGVRRLRSGVFLGACALFLIVLLAAGVVSGRQVLVALGGGLAGVLVYAALFPVAGLGYSFTAVNKDEWTDRFFGKDMALAVLGCAVAVAVAAWLQRGKGGSRGDLARLAWLSGAAFCLPFVVKIAWVYAEHGVFLRWQMPDPYYGFGFYLDVLALMAACFAALPMPLLAWAVARPRATTRS